MKNFDNPIDEMLYILIKESEQEMPDGLSDSDKCWLIDSLVSVRSPGGINSRFKELHDKYVKDKNSVGVVDCTQFIFKKKLALTRADILDLNVDAVVCETLDYLGLMNPNLKCIDNRLVIRGGLDVREQCNSVNIENGYLCRPGSSFCITTPNLNCGYVVKMVLPRVDSLVRYDIDKIKLCVTSAMDILKSKGVGSFAINLALDGMFNISKDTYARVVVTTVVDYMKKSKWKSNCVFVIDSDLDWVAGDLVKVKRIH